MKETRLFLADVDYVSIGNANRARTITPSTVAVFLQINLWIVQAKSDGSEKPPLKIGVSNCLLYDGFFSFAVVRQIKLYLNVVREIPHNSKCRYGERGAAAAKPKAQAILCVLASILATQMLCRSHRSGA